jgi:hypothetical protein
MRTFIVLALAACALAFFWFNRRTAPDFAFAATMATSMIVGGHFLSLKWAPGGLVGAGMAIVVFLGFYLGRGGDDDA